jgi:enoyl-CoA hydratase/3-hydroxyacyl-CoA dehydrogenase
MAAMADGMTVGVVGAGTMGSGIAQKLAQEGLSTILLDVSAEAVERGVQKIGASLDEAVERRIIRPEQKDEILGRITATAEAADMAPADIVIEAVFEDLDVKRDLFKLLGGIVREDAILATNTSSFYVRQVAEVAPNPERVLGLHYFYHPAKNRLVEVVPHEGTSADANRKAWLLQERIGKTPIHSADAPGFVVNRYFVPWLNEAVRLLAEGVATLPTIEQVSKDVFGVGMGPFQLMNVTGVPIALHAAGTLGRELGALYEPCARLALQVDTGELWPLGGEADGAGAETVRERMLGVVFHVAASLVAEGVSSIEDTDIGARVGLRWPKGPFELMNDVGVGEAARMAGAAAALYDAEPAPLLTEQGAKDEPFPIELVRLDVTDGLATLTLNRPDALNALNEPVMAQLAERFVEAAGRDDVNAIALRGAGKAFIAGADVRWFVEQIEADDVDRIIRFTAGGHELLSAFRKTSKPVIAVLDGLSLGGGSELALACDAIVATDRATIGFPETGIGIYPGLGGTQNLPRRVGQGLARYLIYTGKVVGAKDAAALGLVDRLVDLAEVDAAVRELAAAGKPAERTGLSRELPGAWAARAELFNAPAATILAGEVTSEDARLQKDLDRVRKQKAPVALRLSGELTGIALDACYADGLATELAKLPEVFGTSDALVGLKSVLERSRPSFTGA